MSGQKKLVGYAAKFNELSEDLWGFRERVDEGAFRESIQKDDVRLLWNHDVNHVLARTKSKTLKLTEDKTGLHFEGILPDTQLAKDLAVSIQRGDVSQNSFGFNILSERWERRSTGTVRVLTKVRLYDVSPVTYAAYPQTDVHVEDVD